MEFHLSNEISTWTTNTSLFTLLIFICGALLLWIKTSSRKAGHGVNIILPPEADGSWPLIGHLRLLGGSEVFHKTLSKIADKYGPIFMIRIGVHPTIVVSDRKIAKECLATNDRVFVNRPKSVALDHLSYNYTMAGFGPYNPYWVELHKITNVELLSNQRVQMLKHVKILEVKAAIKSIHDSWKERALRAKSASEKVQLMLVVDMKEWFAEINMNVMVRLIAGKALRGSSNKEERDRYQKALKNVFDLLGVFVMADALPFMRWFDTGKQVKAMKKAAIEFDAIIQGWLEERKEERISRSGYVMNNHQYLMDVLLQVLDTPNPVFSGYDADAVIKTTCMAMLLGGTGTSTVTLTWALSLLLNNRHELKKAQDELDTHVGRERQVQDEDIKNLIYIQAIIKETMRLQPAAPTLAPRESITDCNISGYHIPAGTRLFVNVHKIHRDPEVWSDPSEFLPERFLTSHKDIDVRGQNFELIPFGSGRRGCPGVSFALQTMHFTLATLLHSFDFGSQTDESVDMTEGSGMANFKISPLDVALTPRLQDNLYT